MTPAIVNDVAQVAMTQVSVEQVDPLRSRCECSVGHYQADLDLVARGFTS